MKSGFNPIRRNRNIGTAKQGHGRDNRFSIPTVCHSERVWWEQLTTYHLERRTIQSRDLLFIVEDLRRDFAYPCSVEDVCQMLNMLPVGDWGGLQTFVLRQPTRKQLIVSPSWGRIAFAADVGQVGKPTLYSGTALLLEAMKPSAEWRWSKSLAPAALEELERLEEDGHEVQDCGKHFAIKSDPESARSTQLYRTLLHEIGHWVDWQERVERRYETGQDYGELVDAYWSRPLGEREAFAHRYAHNARSQLLAGGAIPFPRIVPAQTGN